MTLKVEWTGARQPTTTKVTPELLALMVDLLPTIGSLRDLCAVTGLRLDTVRKAVQPFLAIMKLQGTHPQCGCGRDRFHPYGCKDSHAKANYQPSPATLARRQMIIDAIMTGETFQKIEHRLGLSTKSARKYQAYMTAEQLAQRKRLEATRETEKKACPTRPFSDGLYARIASAVPRNMSDATRDDIISEMYLAVTDGTLREDDIEANARRFSSSAIGLWESKFGPRSIDVPMFDDGSKTLADVLPDPAALAAFAALDEMQAGRAAWRKAA